MSNTIERLIIRHLAGSKANQIEQLPVGKIREFTIGRDPSSTVAFDPASDNLVSRQHAAIRVNGDGDRLVFELVDCDSSNGTFLNGQRIKKASELLPEDMIELGPKGPKFVFDVQPRPAHLVARTRTIDVDTAATRAIDTAAVSASKVVSTIAANAVAATGASTKTSANEQKRGVGQETVQRLIGEEHRATRRTWVASIAGLGAFLVLGGSALLWKQWSDQRRLESQMTEVVQDVTKDVTKDIEKKNEDVAATIEPRVKSITGMTAQEIYNRYANATAKIFLLWRLYDKGTGLPIYHQVHTVEIDKKTTRTYPAYVRVGRGKIVRWLTTEDNFRRNKDISGAGSGSGFVVAEQGHILTNKHVAAGWEVPFDVPGKYGVLWEYGGGPDAPKPKKRGEPDLRKFEIIDLDDEEYEDLGNWLPESGGIMFPSKPAIAIAIGRGNRVPDPTKAADKRDFAGRNELLDVRFPGSRVNSAASLVRSSPDADAALIKIDSPQPLKTVQLAEDDTIAIGERIIVLGYPGLSVENIQAQQTEEMGAIRSRQEKIPEATVTDGIVAKLATGMKQTDGVTMFSTMGDVIQLTATTGAGNSGGPVFDASGKVIGIFTYSWSNRNRGERVTFAIPIKYGRDLLRAQRE
jgi:serine protease Do